MMSDNLQIIWWMQMSQYHMRTQSKIKTFIISFCLFSFILGKKKLAVIVIFCSSLEINWWSALNWRLLTVGQECSWCVCSPSTVWTRSPTLRSPDLIASFCIHVLKRKDMHLFSPSIYRWILFINFLLFE